MVATILKACFLASLLVMTQANIPLNTADSTTTQGGEGVPGVSSPGSGPFTGSNTETGKVSIGDVSQTFLKKTNTAKVNKRIKKLSKAMNSLLDKLLESGQCDCNKEATTTANKNGIATLRTAVEKLRETVQNRKSSIDEMLTRVEKITANTPDNEYSDEMEKMLDKIQAMKDEVETMAQKVDSDTSTAAGKVHLQKVREALRNMTRMFNFVNENVGECKSKCSKVSEDANNLVTEKQFQALKQSVKQIGENVKAAKTKAMDSTLTDSGQDLESVKNTSESLKTVKDRKLQVIKTNREEVQALREIMMNVQKGVARLAERIEGIRKNNTELKINTDEILEKIRSLKASQREDGQSGGQGYGTLKSALDNFNKSLQWYKKSVSYKSSSFKSMEQVYQELLKAVEAKQTACNKIGEKRKSLEDFIQSAKSQLSKLDFSDRIKSFTSVFAAVKKQVSESKAPKCSLPFRKMHNYCYYVNNIKRTWPAAYTYCQYIGGPTARLLVVDTNTKMQVFSRDVLKRNKEPYFIGMFEANSALKGRKKFKFLNGRLTSDELWNIGQPDGSGKCGKFWNFNRGHMLDDTNCSYKLKSICEIPQ